jgi:hypothetical protein
MNKRSWIGAACLVVLWPAFCACAATVPEIIEFNGTLAWSGTNAPVAGVHPFTIRLYDQATGGTLLWEEQDNVQVDASGRYGVQLGAGTQGTATNSLSDALKLAGSSAFLELEVSINGQTRLFAPRQRLASAPFAMMAGNAYRATKGLTVDGMLMVEGGTQAGQATAGTMECKDVVVTKQITLLKGPLGCDILTSLATNTPVVFSTGVSADKETRVIGNLQVFSMKKPNLTEEHPYSNIYRADTDCWLYMVISNTYEFSTTVTVGSDNYVIQGGTNTIYPVPIPKGMEFVVKTFGAMTASIDTNQNTDIVFYNDSFRSSFFLSLGVTP